MGTPIPDILPVFENEKWYNCHLDCFGDGEGPHTCEDDFIGKVECYKTGLAINTWIADGCECNSDPPVWYELCLFTGISAQRLLHVHGPYDEEEDECGCGFEGLPDNIEVTLSDLIECSDCACEGDWCQKPDGIATALNNQTFTLSHWEGHGNCVYRLHDSEGLYGGILEWSHDDCPPICCEAQGEGLSKMFDSITLVVTLLPKIEGKPRATVWISTTHNVFWHYLIIGDDAKTFTGEIDSNCGDIAGSFEYDCPVLDVGIADQMISSGNILIKPLYE